VKVGDYVRTDSGLIAKYIGIDKKYEWHLFDGNIQWFYEYYREDIDFEDWKEFIEKDVVKSSPNIIDLIEVGDYVNGKEITGVDEYTKQLTYEYGETTMYIDSENIKSIVTKEQFEAMEYKVGVDKE
jgi:hypothetical protein